MRRDLRAPASSCASAHVRARARAGARPDAGAGPDARAGAGDRGRGGRPRAAAAPRCWRACCAIEVVPEPGGGARAATLQHGYSPPPCSLPPHPTTPPRHTPLAFPPTPTHCHPPTHNPGL